MSLWTFTSEAEAVKFSTSGATGSFQQAYISGPTHFALYSGASYFANGTIKYGLNNTRGLTNRIDYQNAYSATAAGCSIINNATSVGLTTTGVTGTFSASMVHPDGFGRYVYSDVCSAPYHRVVVLKINNGVIWSIAENLYRQVVAPGYVGALTLYESYSNYEGTAGISVSSEASALGVYAGINAFFNLRLVYDVYFYPRWSVRVFYKKYDIQITDGLIESVSVYDQSSYYAI